MWGFTPWFPNLPVSVEMGSCDLAELRVLVQHTGVTPKTMLGVGAEGDAQSNLLKDILASESVYLKDGWYFFKRMM